MDHRAPPAARHSGDRGVLGIGGVPGRAGNVAALTDADRQALAELLDTPIRLNVREFLALHLDHTIGRAGDSLADARADTRTNSAAYADSDEDSESDPSAYAIPEPLTIADAFSDGFAYTPSYPDAKAARLPARPEVPQGAVDGH